MLSFTPYSNYLPFNHLQKGMAADIRLSLHGSYFDPQPKKYHYVNRSNVTKRAGAGSAHHP